ncbi:MAG: formylglycine-generating enzyme family protein [Bacteroidales bacterium]|nr:formylglycine-generating enzyme family protein [Bacteroidales bacterium]
MATVKRIVVNGVAFNMVHVEGGTFSMGATCDQGGEVEAVEQPVHQVTLSSFYIGETEVTQALWRAVMGVNPSHFVDNEKPVEQVSWSDCQRFIERLNELTGLCFRLPTEAEWEFAARGGTHSRGYRYSGSNDVESVAWILTNSHDATHRVKQKRANELGLYDMSGNVLEWCQDVMCRYKSSAATNPCGKAKSEFRVNRGGSFCNSPGRCRSSFRNASAYRNKSAILGLRLALDFPCAVLIEEELEEEDELQLF